MQSFLDSLISAQPSDFFDARTGRDKLFQQKLNGREFGLIKFYSKDLFLLSETICDFEADMNQRKQITAGGAGPHGWASPD